MPATAAEPLEIDVQQIPDPRPLIAVDRAGGLEQRNAIQARSGQDAGHSRARHPQGGTDLPRRRARPSQRDDGGLERRDQTLGLPVRARRAVEQLSIVPGAGRPISRPCGR
jgi:hypothetical protein